MIIESPFTLSLAGWSACQGRGGPSPRQKPRLSQRESVEIRPLRKIPISGPYFAGPVLSGGRTYRKCIGS
jgi:hypothetical protein